MDRNGLGSSSALTCPTHDHGHVQRCGQGKPTATTSCPSCPYLSLKTRRRRKKGVETHYWEVLGKRVGQYGQVDRAHLSAAEPPPPRGGKIHQDVLLRDALQPTGNVCLPASGRGRSGALKVFSAKTSTKSTLREILPSGQAKARNGLCLPSTMRLPIDWALVMWIVMGKTLFPLV